MPFVPYARTPGRLAVQVAGDLLLVAWCWAWYRVGRAVEAATLQLAEPGRQLDEGATDVATGLREAGDRAADLPLVGDDLAAPFTSAGDAAASMAQAGQRQVEVVTELAALLLVVVVAVPVLVAVAGWLPRRIRFGLRAGAARKFVDADADLQLFALRAMTNQPMHRLARISDDPVAAWRRGDTTVVHALAAMELADFGLRPPRPPRKA